MTALLFLMLAFQEPLLAALEQPIRVEGEVTQPEVIKRVEPNFNSIPKAQRLNSPIILEAVIDQEGRVRDVRVLRSKNPPEANEICVRALEQWRFKPVTLHGKPVKVYFSLLVRPHPR